MKDIDDTRAPLLDHLIELRRRLLWSLAALGLAFAVCLYFARPIFAFLVQPLLRAGQGRLIYTNIFEAFFVEVKVAFFAAIMVAFPVVANQNSCCRAHTAECRGSPPTVSVCRVSGC